MTDRQPSAPTDLSEPRPHCYRCDKPAGLCLCALLTPLPNRVGVHVLQHPAERRHAVGTARLLRLGLASVQVHALSLRGTSSASPPVQFPPGTGLLYPCPPDQELGAVPPGARPANIVVIDGTWAQAHRVFRENPWVAALPRYRLAPERESNYRIRKEPRKECLSTVETVVAALRILEPDLPGTQTLLSAFDAMIDAQIAAAAASPGRPAGKRARKRPPRHVPQALTDPGAAVFVGVVEFTARGPGSVGPRGALRVSVVSLDGARVFDRVAQVRPRPDPRLLERTGLDARALQAASPEPQVRDELRAWLLAGAAGRRVVLCCWDQSTQGWLVRHIDGVPCVVLKAVWANLSRRKIGQLGEVVEELGLAPVALPLVGRAGPRLSWAHAMAAHILDEHGRGADHR